MPPLKCLSFTANFTTLASACLVLLGSRPCVPNVELIHGASQHSDPCHVIKATEAAHANEKVVPFNGSHSNQIFLNHFHKSGHWLAPFWSDIWWSLVALAWVGKSPARFHSFPEKGLSRVGEYDVHRYLLRDTHLIPCSGRWLFCVVPFCPAWPFCLQLAVYVYFKKEKTKNHDM